MSINVKPQQLEFLDWEFGVFFHFGIRTFYEGHVDWDLKEMPLEGFNPKELDCENWIKNIKSAGAKYAVLVCKHHDGFANWPSKYTDYSVKNTPWRDGKGDVVADFVSACRKYDVKIGLYYSPAQFGSIKMNHDEYDDYFINQISELLTNYGKIDYLWFDGCGSEGHEYNKTRIIKAIRSLQPDILIFNMWDPDTMWCGNEHGYCESPNFNFRDFEGEKRFLPWECDCRIRRSWFYFDSDKDTLKSTDVLMGMYINSVGRGANLLLNVAPDRRGLLLEDDCQRLREFSDEVKRRFGTPIALTDKLDGNTMEICMDEFKAINAIEITENPASEHPVTNVEIYASLYPTSEEIFLTSARSVGHKLILPIPTFAARRFVARFTCDKAPEIKSFKLYGDEKLICY